MAKANKKDAVQKAMELLNYSMRTEAELRQRLAQCEYSPEEIRKALDYVSGFGYLNDKNYAQQFVLTYGKDKGRRLLTYELKKKGVGDHIIEEALTNAPEEDETVYELIVKKVGEPHILTEKEYKRTGDFLCRRGFSTSSVYKMLRKYQEDGQNE